MSEVTICPICDQIVEPGNKVLLTTWMPVTAQTDAIPERIEDMPSGFHPQCANTAKRRGWHTPRS